MKKVRKLSRKNEDIVLKQKDSFTDSTEKGGPEQIQFMFETIKCSIVIIILKNLVETCESINHKIFNINASNIP